ncbi:uncharacterized protein LOC118185355 isoform X2 [Stegodyphus dumicola]|uniref:uncharacterized protein LOC118185355 isoform X2 n=1 Tax=Stegodyphus dumicola TaxID=202533 RepID=UPI0015AD1133|nr:uncharacterized protein LOC118185355 isoform X2 [Stegodyphus dumicola]
MGESFGYRYNPSYTPEPHFIPGYGGHLPGVLTRFGTRYGNASYEVLRQRPMVASRLAPLRSEEEKKKEDSFPLHCQCKKEIQLHKQGIITNEEEMFLPEHICPGYTGCLSLKKKGLPLNICCDEVLRSLGCHQDAYQITESRQEDPFPGPPPVIDHTQDAGRLKDGMWLRFPENYVNRENFKWM